MNFLAKTKDWFKSTFTLVDNWRQVLLRSWTVWLAVGAFLFGTVEYWQADVLALLPVALPFLPESVARAISTILTAAIPLARIKKQLSLAIAEAKKVTVVHVDVGIDATASDTGGGVIVDTNVTQKPS